MKYKKASDVLPDELLKEVQKYVDGEALYFPKHKKRKNWGENTGAQDFYKRKNFLIRIPIIINGILLMAPLMSAPKPV